MKYNGLDERQMQINIKAMAFGGVFLTVCVAAAMIYKVCTAGELGWEFWAIIGTCLVLLISRNLLGDVEPPKSLLGQFLPTGDTPEEKGRRKRSYALESLLFAGACAVMDVLLIGFGWDEVTDLALTEMLFPNLGHVATTAVTAVIVLVSVFVLSYVFEYLVGEKFKMKRYNKMIAALEEE